MKSTLEKLRNDKARRIINFKYYIFNM